MITSLHLRLEYVVDTHVHADHLSGAPRLAELLGATYVVHENSGSSCAGHRVSGGDTLSLGALEARVLHTPGHAADAISLVFHDRILTGDFLFIGSGGAGRVDLPGGDAGEHWDALRELRRLPTETLVFPGHDYHGRRFSTLAEERRNNPRLAPRTREDYVSWLEGQDLGPTDWMVDVIGANYSCEQAASDIRVPTGASCEVAGTLGQEAVAAIERVEAPRAAELVAKDHALVIDVREPAELLGPLGFIRGARNVPLGSLAGELESLETERDKPIITVCRSGARSDSAAARLRAAGFETVFSLSGGMEKWNEWQASASASEALDGDAERLSVKR